MDISKMEQLYQKIATQLDKIIPDPWQKVLLHAEIDEWMQSSYFYYYSQNKSAPVYNLDIKKIYDNINPEDLEEEEDILDDYIRELWEEYKRNNQEPWTNLTFILYSDGNFNIDYDYTDLDNCEFNHYERRLIWQYEELGILPDEDKKSDINVIEEYKKRKDKE